jgi:branched-chain amino acid transport system ATP-binding protein
MLKVHDLHAAYGLSEVLFGISLRAERGEIVSLLGRNGAGKTTTLKCIIGLLPPKAGRVLYKGEPIAGLPPHLISRRGIGYVPEDRRIFPDLTVFENLEVGRRPESVRPGEPPLERVLALFPALKALRHRKAGSLSGGEQQMLTIGRTLMGEPELLLLDEPSEGLAPVVAQALQRQTQTLKAQGLTIVVSEQNVKFVAPLADRAYIMEKGQIVYEGPMTDLVNNAEIRRQHLAL